MPSLSFVQKIVATLVGLVLLFAVAAVLTGWKVFAVDAVVDEMVDSHMQQQQRAADLRYLLLQLRRAEKDITLDLALRPEGVSKRVQAFADLSQKTRALSAMALEGAAPAHKPQTAAVVQSLEAYVAGVSAVTARVGRGEIASIAAFDAAIDAPRKLARDAEQGASALIEALAAESKAAHAEFDQAIVNLKVVQVAGFAGAAVCAGLMGLWLVRTLRRPLAALGIGIERLRSGELGHRVATFGNDELGRMSQQFNDMAQQLGRLVDQVKATSTEIATASDQIAQGNQDLSARTERSAASLEETASAMDQLSGTIAHTADSAAQASEIASRAQDACERGGAAVQEAVQGMDGMRASGQQIAEIIGLIDAIAFQTNILALNAAVEAARAGEQGKGFAVVASEVRALAGRTATAARDVKSLIKGTLDQVDQGAAKVAQAGSVVGELLEQVRHVRTAMDEIRLATQQQREGIAQVNTAVNELDRSTQQNSALVEQAAAAAASLRTQSREMVAAVSGFR